MLADNDMFEAFAYKCLHVRKHMFLIILNKWNRILGHLEDEDWQLTGTKVAKKTYNLLIFSLKGSTSTTIGSYTTRRMVCVCLRWQCLRRWFLPIANATDQPSAFNLFRSRWKYKLLLYECLRLLPHFRWLAYNPDIFFSTCVRGKHRPKRNNLRMKAQSFKKSETWCLDKLLSSLNQ